MIDLLWYFALGLAFGMGAAFAAVIVLAILATRGHR